MSEQIVQVADASPSTKNMRTIQQTAGGNTVQSEVVILATGAANGGDTYDARQIRTLTSSDIIAAWLKDGSGASIPSSTGRPATNAVGVNVRVVPNDSGDDLIVKTSSTSQIQVTNTPTVNQGSPAALANAWPVKLTDGTNGLTFLSQADLAGGSLLTSTKGPFVQAELTGIAPFGSTLAPINSSILPSGATGLLVVGGTNDSQVVGFPDTTNSELTALTAVSNATTPPSTGENAVGFLSMDLNRKLRTRAIQDGTWNVNNLITDPVAAGQQAHVNYVGQLQVQETNSTQDLNNAYPMWNPTPWFTITPWSY